MISVSGTFKQRLASSTRKYLAFADITLKNNTTLHLTNAELWAGGFSIEDAVSEDEAFTALGSTVINAATIVINNMNETYNDYDFTDAKVVLSVGFELPENDATVVKTVKKGTFHVDETPEYNGFTVRLSMLDNMEYFDRPYSESNLTYPASLIEIVLDACTHCGVTLATTDFPHKMYEIPNRPTDDALTYRDILGAVATIAGCYARCNIDGKLELKWFDTQAIESLSSEDYDGGTFNPWTTGDSVDGGSFNPWTTGDSVDGGTFLDARNAHYINKLRSQNIGLDDIVITGVQIALNLEDQDSNGSYTKTYSTGTSNYVIKIENNPLITETNVNEILTWLGTLLIGLRFRKLSVTHLSDPTIEAGDVAFVWDSKGRKYQTLITRVTFAIGSLQTIVCGAEAPARNSATRYANSTKAYVEARKAVNREKTLRTQALDELANAIAAQTGMYSTEVSSQSGGSIFYLHDQPNLVDSKAVWRMSGNAFSVTNDWQGSDQATSQAEKWVAGLTVDGTLITNILSTSGISFDWARGGTLKLGGDDNVNGILKIYNSSDIEVGRWTKDGLYLGNFGSNINNANTIISADGKITSKNVYIRGGDDSHIEVQNTNYIGFCQIIGDGFKSRFRDTNDPAGVTVLINKYSLFTNHSDHQYMDYTFEVADGMTRADYDEQYRPGYYNDAVALKAYMGTDNVNKPRTYCAIGVDYIEAAYNTSTTRGYGSFIRMCGQLNELIISSGSYQTQLGLSGFVSIKGHETPENDTVTIGSKTYHIRGGILCLD